MKCQCIGDCLTRCAHYSSNKYEEKTHCEGCGAIVPSNKYLSDGHCKTCEEDALGEVK